MNRHKKMDALIQLAVRDRPGALQGLSTYQVFQLFDLVIRTSSSRLTPLQLLREACRRVDEVPR